MLEACIKLTFCCSRCVRYPWIVLGFGKPASFDAAPLCPLGCGAKLELIQKRLECLPARLPDGWQGLA